MIKRFTLVAALVVALAAMGFGASSASAAASCHLSVSPYSNGAHPAAQATFDTCTDVDKIQFFFYFASGGEWYDDGVAGTELYANKMLGVNACGSNGWITPGSSFTCQAVSGTICGSPTAGCSIWAYKTDYTMACYLTRISAFVGYKLHRYSTNTWGGYAYFQTPRVSVC